jgi:hypothetical protein
MDALRKHACDFDIDVVAKLHLALMVQMFSRR